MVCSMGTVANTDGWVSREARTPQSSGENCFPSFSFGTSVGEDGRELNLA